MNVLVACEFSGIVREAFISMGHEATSCDLLPSEIPCFENAQHYQGDIFELLDNKWGWTWDLLIAHPPCTYLSNAGARHLYPKGILNNDRFRKGLEAKEFFMRLFLADIPMIAIENPIPSTIFDLPKYDQIIQPYEYGHPIQKRTCLWLKNLPKLKPTNIVSERQSTKISGNWFNKGGKDRQKERARTFQGIAEAMAQQWGGL